MSNQEDFLCQMQSAGTGFFYVAEGSLFLRSPPLKFWDLKLCFLELKFTDNQT